MSIIFKFNAISKLNKVYLLRFKNREIIDFTFNKLYKQKKLY